MNLKTDQANQAAVHSHPSADAGGPGWSSGPPALSPFSA